VDLPVGQVAVIASFDGGGVHAEVRDRGDGLPACADTPAGPLDPRVDCG
jgi:hypothetical protein